VDVTRDVILDLLPLYLAGETSPATRALVDAYLKTDPELAARAREGSAALPKVELGPRPELELESLRKTRTVMRRLRWLFALAISTTALSLATRVQFAGGGISEIRLLVLDYPWLFGPGLGLAVVFWVAYLGLRRRVRVIAW
jgi:anti-sigma factor RsiW